MFGFSPFNAIAFPPLMLPCVCEQCLPWIHQCDYTGPGVVQCILFCHHCVSLQKCWNVLSSTCIHWSARTPLCGNDRSGSQGFSWVSFLQVPVGLSWEEIACCGGRKLRVLSSCRTLKPSRMTDNSFFTSAGNARRNLLLFETPWVLTTKTLSGILTL